MTKQRIIRILDVAGLKVFEPLVRLATGEDPKEQLRLLGMYFLLPALAFIAFLAAWHICAINIVTKYGTLPTPAAVWVQGSNLLESHRQTRANEAQFYEDQQTKSAEHAENAVKLRTLAETMESPKKEKAIEAAEKLDEKATEALTKKFSASPTYIDQIITSLYTVFAGFVIASLIAIPTGILCGMSRAFSMAVNPLIQIFKPVSPLAWLPIVMIVVGALYTTPPAEAWFEKSFISSAFTVALCSLWPTLVNTALGVASIEKDHLNVARVLNLSSSTRVRMIVIPSALPFIFAGLRISLGVGWMVLIAAEMLAQNPGLGKFVWDMFQNGSSETLAQIMVAVFTIGIIGFLLDRVMIVLQRSVSYDTTVAT